MAQVIGIKKVLGVHRLRFLSLSKQDFTQSSVRRECGLLRWDCRWRGDILSNG